MKITIIACGWLGLPLGKYLVNNGHLISGSTTSNSKFESLKNAGIMPYLLKLSPEIECENFDQLINSEIIIINIPPRVAKNGTEFHLIQINSLITSIQKKYEGKSLPKIIFISSTSVYPENNQIATEITVIDDNSVLIKAENLLKSAFEKVTVLRLGGLMGFDRIPAKYYEGKPMANWATAINYIHQTDAILIISHILEHNIWNETFNICSPIHPSRKEIITKNCEDLGFELPVFSENPAIESFKIIAPSKFINFTNYKFKFENPLDFYYSPDAPSGGYI